MNKKAGSSFKSQTGFSMTEMLIAVAMLGGLLMAAMSLMNTLSSEANSADAKLNFEEELIHLQAFLERPFRNAVNLRAATTIPKTYAIQAASNYTGQVVRAYNSATLPNDGDGETVAIFMRETADFNPAGTRTAFRPTALIFQRPREGPNHRYGMLYVDLGLQSTTAVAPDHGDQQFPFITELAVDSPHAAGEIVKRLTFRVTMRNFPTSPNNAQDKATMVYCPADDMTVVANCPNTRNYRDITRDFSIDLNNNTGLTASEFNDFALGRIYFLR